MSEQITVYLREWQDFFLKIDAENPQLSQRKTDVRESLKKF